MGESSGARLSVGAQENGNSMNGAHLRDLPPSFGNALRRKRILHVEYDRSLLATRHVLLETAGFEVISCFDGRAAREVSTGSVNFDLFLVGHAASLHERTELVTWIRSNFPNVAVVVLRSRDTDGSPLGDANVIADPEELLKKIVETLNLR
jgi:PleD family two-component response regulator